MTLATRCTLRSCAKGSAEHASALIAATTAVMRSCGSFDHRRRCNNCRSRCFRMSASCASAPRDVADPRCAQSQCAVLWTLACGCRRRAARAALCCTAALPPSSRTSRHPVRHPAGPSSPTRDAGFGAGCLSARCSVSASDTTRPPCPCPLTQQRTDRRRHAAESRPRTTAAPSGHRHSRAVVPAAHPRSRVPRPKTAAHAPWRNKRRAPPRCIPPTPSRRAPCGSDTPSPRSALGAEPGAADKRAMQRPAAPPAPLLVRGGRARLISFTHRTVFFFIVHRTPHSAPHRCRRRRESLRARARSINVCFLSSPPFACKRVRSTVRPPVTRAEKQFTIPSLNQSPTFPLLGVFCL